MYERILTPILRDALQDSPVILLNGARQVGKSTLIRFILENSHDYYTLDDPSILNLLKKDPLTFLQNLKKPVVIDEIQRAPESFIAIKKIVDEKRIPGFFVLTGSANVLALSKLSESLAGRMEVYTLWPLSQAELEGTSIDFISKLFEENTSFSIKNSAHDDDILERLLKGGYPPAILKKDALRRKYWFRSYIMTLLQKDIRDLTHIEGLSEIPNLLSLLATRVGTLMNTSEISRSMGLPNTTLKRYLTLLETLYLITPLPAWSSNLSKRLIKTPKIFFNDTGIVSYLLSLSKESLLFQKHILGHLLENFVVSEVLKAVSYSSEIVHAFHYRTHSGQEIDILLQNAHGKIAGIEVKSKSSVQKEDFKGIFALEEDIKEKFVCGVVLYMGKTIIPFGHNKYALPISILWD